MVSAVMTRKERHHDGTEYALWMSRPAQNMAQPPAVFPRQKTMLSNQIRRIAKGSVDYMVALVAAV